MNLLTKEVLRNLVKIPEGPSVRRRYHWKQHYAILPPIAAILCISYYQILTTVIHGQRKHWSWMVWKKVQTLKCVDIVNAKVTGLPFSPKHWSAIWRVVTKWSRRPNCLKHLHILTLVCLGWPIDLFRVSLPSSVHIIITAIAVQLTWRLIPRLNKLISP